MSQIFYVREKLLELLFLLCENINFLKTIDSSSPFHSEDFKISHLKTIVILPAFPQRIFNINSLKTIMILPALAHREDFTDCQL